LHSRIHYDDSPKHAFDDSTYARLLGVGRLVHDKLLNARTQLLGMHDGPNKSHHARRHNQSPDCACKDPVCGPASDLSPERHLTVFIDDAPL